MNYIALITAIEILYNSEDASKFSTLLFCNYLNPEQKKSFPNLNLKCMNHSI